VQIVGDTWSRDGNRKPPDRRKGKSENPNLIKGETMRIRNHAGKWAVTLALALGVAGPAFGSESRHVDLGRGVTINGTEIAPGKYKVTWDSSQPETTVTFKHKKSVVTATGTIVERPQAYENDSVVYDEDGSGNTTLVEIRFAGSKKVISFSELSPPSSASETGASAEVKVTRY
jgi:hypothetical protein